MHNCCRVSLERESVAHPRCPSPLASGFRRKYGRCAHLPDAGSQRKAKHVARAPAPSKDPRASATKPQKCPPVPTSHDVHPNFHRLKTAYSELPYYNAAPIPALDIRNGFYHVPNTLGPGHELNPDYVAAGPTYPSSAGVNTSFRRKPESRGARAEGFPR